MQSGVMVCQGLNPPSTVRGAIWLEHVEARVHGREPLTNGKVTAGITYSSSVRRFSQRGVRVTSFATAEQVSEFDDMNPLSWPKLFMGRILRTDIVVCPDINGQDYFAITSFALQNCLEKYNDVTAILEASSG